MDSNQKPNGNTESEFVTEADWIPGFWNYLLDLDKHDLVAELIQNDFDQDATRTVISFEPDQIVCEGNGKPVGPDGWRRLRMIQGAGGEVPAKRGKIGVKNHGLKTTFTVGDEIRLMSDGQAITQTLYANGRNKPPHPGASRHPETDKRTPKNGCLITIKLRDKPIEPPQGEATLLKAVNADDIERLFLAACESAPEQFAGIVSPEVAPRYEIVLRHWDIGEARFQFSCSRPKSVGNGIELFRRRCRVTGTIEPLPGSISEMAARRLIPLRGRLKKRAADFFRRDNRFFVEVSWPVGRRGKPLTGTGRLRYPIGYPSDSVEALTGHGVSFNAPIVSDNKRHGPARNEATNPELREKCEALLVDVLSRHVLPRWGATGLDILVPCTKAENEDEAVRPLLAKLARRNVIPTLSWRVAMRTFNERKRGKFPAGTLRLSRRGGSLKRKYKFVTPTTTWDVTKIDIALATVSPTSERQIDPRTHTEILRLFADRKTEGFCELFITFDQNDAICRAMGESNNYFDAPPNLTQEFAQPFIARAYLDIISDSLGRNECDEEDELLGSLQLPDSRGVPAPIEEMYTSAPLPTDVPGLNLPPILHAELTAHPIFRRKNWRRKKYTMRRFLESDVLRDADRPTRQSFWNWLCKNSRHVNKSDRPKLADIPIWPDQDGNLCILADLCDPRSSRVAKVLGNSICQPDNQVRRSKLLSSSPQARCSVRRTPTEDEIDHWLNRRIDEFVAGEMPSKSTVKLLRRFEADLTVLLKEASIARLLRETFTEIPAQAKDKSLQHRSDLVMPGPKIDRLALCDRFLLKDKKHAETLDKMSPSRSAPTAAMMLETFDEDPMNFDVLQARLESFLSLTQLGDASRRQLAEMPIIPIQGQPVAPATLVFAGNKGDFWGDWKHRISGKGLSQEDQRRYRDVGVNSSFPNEKTSRVFFEWLSEETEEVLERHIACVLRHIIHRYGPTCWAETFTDIPFIPVRHRDGLNLVSLQDARHRPVFVPDVKEVAEAILSHDPKVMFVIESDPKVAEPITKTLRNFGIGSLREALGAPTSVTGIGDASSADQDMLDSFSALCNRHFRHTFQKRLNKLGVDRDLVRHDWHDRLSRVSGVRFAESVEALYRFRHKDYRVRKTGGFDPSSRVFWMEKSQNADRSSFYETIAAQLVFRPSAPPLYYMALERALEIEIQETSYRRFHSRAGGAGGEYAADEIEVSDGLTEGESEASAAEVEPSEAVHGHAPFEPDPSRNMPNPGPIPSTPAKGSVSSARRRRDSGRGKGGTQKPPVPKLEQEHIETLKRDQYASHCQMCVCKRSPRDLAPQGSYIEWEEVRRSVVEAHHVDLKSARGARHAGNLILLCKYHHDNYGRRLTRAAITDALQRESVDKEIRFGEGNEEAGEIQGKQIELMITDNGEVVELFFTNEHVDFWLSNA